MQQHQLVQGTVGQVEDTGVYEQVFLLLLQLRAMKTVSVYSYDFVSLVPRLGVAWERGYHFVMR